MQVWTSTLPPKRIPIRHSMSVTSWWGERLAPSDYNQTNPAWHPRSAQWAKCQRSCTSRSLHNLLVSLVMNTYWCLDLLIQVFNIMMFLCSQNRLEYDKRVRAQARAMAATEWREYSIGRKLFTATFHYGNRTGRKLKYWHSFECPRQMNYIMHIVILPSPMMQCGWTLVALRIIEVIIETLSSVINSVLK